MTPRTGLAGAVVQRSLADWPVVLAALLLLICATTLLATGVVYGDAVAAGGLHRAMLDGPPSARSVVVGMAANPDQVDALDAIVRPELARAMTATGGAILREARTGSFANVATPADQVTDLTVFESLDGLEDQATLLDGTWPTAGAEPIQATLSDLAAKALDLRVGDELAAVSRQDPSARVDAVVVGIWRADPDAAWSRGDPLETTGVTTGGSFTTRGPLVIREADLLGLPGRPRIDMEWRGLPYVSALQVDEVDELSAGVSGLPARLAQVVPAGTTPRLTTTLPASLDTIGRNVLVSRSGVILLTIQFAILAGYAVLLVAGLLVERRRSEIALLRSRGATSSHLTRMALLEAVILAVPAAIAAPFLAVGIVGLLGSIGPTAGLGLLGDAEVSTRAIAVSVLAAAAAVVVLTLPTLSVAASPAGARAADARPSTASLPQRLGLDLALLAVAAIALWQLRLYGAPLTVNARGTLGLDPLLVAAPAIGLIAGAVLALRVVPRVAELLERVLVRGRGLVGALGGRQLARRPLRYSRAALLLILATALGTLAASHAATWLRSQRDQAAWQAVADVRATGADYPTLPAWAAGPVYRAIQGVAAATPVIDVPFSVGRAIREGTLVGLDPEAVGSIATAPAEGTAGEPPATTLAPIVAARSAVPVVALPDGTRRVAVTVDADFEMLGQNGGEGTSDEEGAMPISPGTPGLSVDLVLRDGDGRLIRTAAAEGSLVGAGQRLVVELGDPRAAGLLPGGPLAIEAIEVTIAPPSFDPIGGTADLVRVETTPAGTGDGSWTPVDVSGATPGWHWDRTDDGEPAAYPTSAGQPNRVAVSAGAPSFLGANGGTRFRLAAGAGANAGPEPEAIPVVASDAFLATSGLAVGDTVQVSSTGRTIGLRIVGSTPGLAPFDPTKPILYGDLATVDLARFGSTGRVSPASEWWIRTRPGAEGPVLTALRASGMDVARAVGREELTRSLTTDPVPLGLIGILALGSVAAMVFAAIGFLVTSTVSASERLGEFALLRALGLSTRQLSWWLSIESIFLLVVGLVAGALLGAVLAWLVLPFTTLTRSGAAPVPPPVVVMPWDVLLPVYLGAIALFILAPILARRQLPDVRISGVLRARES
ncbi:MAG TPA: ABC transporter permease [Candidatus Limnocylindrales bacterium]